MAKQPKKAVEYVKRPSAKGDKWVVILIENGKAEQSWLFDTDKEADAFIKKQKGSKS